MADDQDTKTEKHEFTSGIKKPGGGTYRYTAKERLFVYHYMTDPRHVAVKACREAGYNAISDASFRVIASNLLKKPHIIAAINHAFESLTMPKMEVLFRLGVIAQGSVEDLLNDDDEFDIELARRNGKAALIRKMKIKRTRRVVEQIVPEESFPTEDPRVMVIQGDGERREQLESSIIFEEITFEIHDPLRALELIGKHGRLFTDKLEHSGPEGVPLPDKPANVTIILPDNGRGDATARPATRATKKTTQDKDPEIKDA